MDIGYIEEEQEDSKLKKIIIALVGLILIFLMISYILGGSSLIPFLASLSESTKSNGTEINLDNFSIMFSNETWNSLQESYYQNQNQEFTACLLGMKEINYNINEIFYPEIISQSVNHVTYKPCPQNTLINIHSHPYRKCIASQQDLDTLDTLKKENQEVLIIIMCEPNRFSVY